MPPEENTADLGGLSLPSADSSATGNSAPSADSSASAQVIRERKKRSDAGQSRGTRSAQSTGSVPPLSQGLFAKLYDPEIWGRALGTPADTMAAITGKQHWLISEKEKEALGATGSIAAQVYAVSDPRALALALCALTVIDVYGVRLAKDWADSRKEKAEEEKKKKLNP